MKNRQTQTKNPGLNAGIAIFLIISMFVGAAQASDKDRKQKQQKLDAECQAARSELIAPLKEQYTKECIATQKRQKDPVEYCNRFYADYGERSGDRPAMYMDLPQCEKAFDNEKSSRF